MVAPGSEERRVGCAFDSRFWAHRDGRRFDGQPSISAHCGLRGTCQLARPSRDGHTGTAGRYLDGIFKKGVRRPGLSAITRRGTTGICANGPAGVDVKERRTRISKRRETRRRSAMAASHGRRAPTPAIARRARSVRRAPIFIAGRNASRRAAASRRACASPSAHPVSSRRSSACASISPCGAAPSSAPSCASGASLSPTPPSGASSPNSSPAVRFRPYRRCAAFPTSARRWTAERNFARAQRLPSDLTANEPGGLVQLDTEFHVNVAPDKSIKHFTAYDPIAKWTVAKAFNRATAASAAIFLEQDRRRNALSP